MQPGVAAWIALLVAVGVGCDDAEVVDCGAGRREVVAGETYCVYAPGAVPEPGAVSCPADAPARVRVGDSVVCTSDRDAMGPEDLPPTLCAGCGATCSDGLVRCGELCTDVGSDLGNCGTCGAACGPNERCAGGACVCDGRNTRCGPDCVDLTATRGHCGVCGGECPHGHECCAGECQDVESDVRHCGACGVECPAGTSCFGRCRGDHDACESPRELPVREGAATVDLSAGERTSSPEGCTDGGDFFYRVSLEQRELVQLAVEDTDRESQIARLAGPCGGPASLCEQDACAGLGSMLVEELAAGQHRFVVELLDVVSVVLRHIAVPEGALVGELSPGPIALAADASSAGEIAAACGSGPEVAWRIATCPSYPGGRLTVSTCSTTSPTVAATLALLRSDGEPVCGAPDPGCPMGSMLSVSLPAGSGLYLLVAELAAPASGTIAIEGSWL